MKMNASENSVVGQFANRCQALLARIQETKEGLRSEFEETLEAHGHLLQLALNEAEALAWQTGYPQLVFPVLAREKAERVANWEARQRFIRRPDSLLAVA